MLQGKANYSVIKAPRQEAMCLRSLNVTDKYVNAEGLYSEQLTAMQPQQVSLENNQLWPLIYTWAHSEPQEILHLPKLIASTCLV